MQKLSELYNRDLSGEIAIVRVDLNINARSLAAHTDNLRIRSIIPTIAFLTKRHATVVLVSHRGRPVIEKGKKSVRQENVREFTLKPFASIIGKLLKKRITFIPFDTTGSALISQKNIEAIRKAPKGSLFLLENMRFLAGEENNDPAVVAPLAEVGTFYVNDAFAVSHRKNASVVAITKLLPSCAGLLLEKEIFHLDKAMHAHDRPFVLILGGAKMADKMGLIKQFARKADYLLPGGGIANTLLAADGLPIGNSVFDAHMLPIAKTLLRSKKVLLPFDVVIDQRKIVDHGQQTIEEWMEIVRDAKTIIWNGPLGVIEDKRFAKSSIAIAKAIAKSKAFAVVGGGETALAFAGIRLTKNTFLSTGGGAMLPGMLDITESQLRVPARTGMPVRLSNMPGELAHPSFSTAIGMLLYAHRTRVTRAAENNSLRAKLRAIFASSF